MRFGVREILFVFVLLAIPVASFMLVFKPRNAEIQEAKEEISRKRADLQKLSETTLRINDLGAAIVSWEEAIDLIEAKLPGEQQVDQVLRQAWEIADRHGLVIDSVAPDKKLDAGQFMELPIKVELSGDFDGFYRFLLDLEQLPRLTRIKNLKMERMSDVDGAMTAKFTLSVFFEARTRSLSGANS
ncbi:MAG: type 4a pilus biogenesis protein PilO [Phycisphaerales bacterium]